MSRPTPPAYKTRNWPADNEALKRRGSLAIWFDPEMTWEAKPTGKRGRQPDYSDAAIQTCLTMKVLFGMVWRKIHLGIDVQTLEIWAAEFTTSDVGDAPMLPELLDQIPPDQEIGSVTADGAFDTRKCHEAIAARGAAAIIPPRKNAKPWRPDTAGAIARNEALRASRRFGRTIWRRWSGYHRRNRVETKMHCVKLLGQRLTARDFDRQVAEFQVRVAVLNGFTALGRPITEAVGQVRPGKGEVRLSPNLCNRADRSEMPSLAPASCV